MKIYVDGEMPKSCYDCKFTYQEHSFDRLRCLFDGKHICDNKQQCPLQTLAEHEKQVRKQVVKEIRQKLKNYTLSNDNDFMFGTFVKVVDISKVLDRTERSEKDEKHND